MYNEIPAFHTLVLAYNRECSPNYSLRVGQWFMNKGWVVGCPDALFYETDTNKAWKIIFDMYQNYQWEI